jgi:UDP-N-acetylglucosamine 2-epimerase (non-hydrolysing)
MAPVLAELSRKQTSGLKSVLCVTAQHRELLDEALRVFNIRPDFDLNLMQPNQTPQSFATAAAIRVAQVLGKVKPDLVLVQGDTVTAVIGALAASSAGIPVGHVEAGLRTERSDVPFPEEMNRRLLGRIATYHFAPTPSAVTALLKEGRSPNTVFLTGNTVVDALKWLIVTNPSPPSSPGTMGLDHIRRQIVLVTAHRRENFGPPIRELCRALLVLAQRNREIEIVFPQHRNPNICVPVSELLEHQPRIRVVEPLDYISFVKLMRRSYMVLTDSGGVQEEAAALGKPTLILRSETERPESVDVGTAKLVGTEAERIIAETKYLLTNSFAYKRMSRRLRCYGDGYAAQRIAGIICRTLQLIPSTTTQLAWNPNSSSTPARPTTKKARGAATSSRSL